MACGSEFGTKKMLFIQKKNKIRPSSQTEHTLKLASLGARRGRWMTKQAQSKDSPGTLLTDAVMVAVPIEGSGGEKGGSPERGTSKPGF